MAKARFKNTKKWKTKIAEDRRYMICMNSDLGKSKYPDWAPDGGESKCNEWVEVGANTDTVLCSYCTRRSLEL